VRTKDEIRQLLKRLDGEPADALEDEDLEFKPWDDDPRSLIRTLRELAVCFANRRGGTIVLGVRDRLRTRGDAIEGAGRYDVGSLRRGIYDGTDPHILADIEELVEPEGQLVLVHIPPGMPPHTTSDGVARIRVGKECRPLTGRAFAQLLASGGQTDLTAQVIPGASEGDLDPSQVAELRRVIRREAQSAELATLDDLALLSALGLIMPDGVTFTGLLLVGTGESISRYVPQHEVTFLRYRSATRYDQRTDLRGPLLAVLNAVEQLVSVHNRVNVVQEEGFGQFEFPDLSWEVAREAVLNAVTHRDYFLRQGVQVALYRDRLEVDSPGGFVGGITPENVLRHPPIHRNELLARALQSIGLVNRVGIGVDRIYSGLLRLGKDVPRYTADEAHVRLSIPLQTHEAFALFVASEERRGHELELDELLLLRELLRTSALDRWSAAQVLQLPEESAADKLMGLREAGYVIVRGRGRGTAYTLTRNLAERLRGKAAVDAEAPFETEAVRLRVLELLRQRGALTNAQVRRFSGFNRTQVYRLLKRLEAEGKIKFEGRGRGAHIVSAKATTQEE